MQRQKKDDAMDLLPDAAAVDAAAPHAVGTADLLSKAMGISVPHARNLLARLRDAGRVHIHCWTDELPVRAVWASGPGEDAPKPIMTEDQRIEVNRTRARRKSREERIAEGAPGRASVLTAKTIQQAIAKPRTWMSWLGEPDGA